MAVEDFAEIVLSSCARAQNRWGDENPTPTAPTMEKMSPTALGVKSHTAMLARCA